MSRASRPVSERSFHPLAFKFVFSALRHTQTQLGRDRRTEATGHISGAELLEGIRQLGLENFGMLSPVVFRAWGIHSTADFGEVVFQMIAIGEMKKTADDQLDDFRDVFDFDRVFSDDYTLDTSEVFSKA